MRHPLRFSFAMIAAAIFGYADPLHGYSPWGSAIVCGFLSGVCIALIEEMGRVVTPRLSDVGNALACVITAWLITLACFAVTGAISVYYFLVVTSIYVVVAAFVGAYHGLKTSARQ
jgi:hypothetical protein